MKVIKIPATKDKFHRQILEMLRSFPPFTSLRPKELDVLAQLMKYNEEHSNLDSYSRAALISSPSFKKKMRDELNMGEDSFNNNMSRLRKYKLISKDNSLHKFISSIHYNKDYEIKFIFKTNEPDSK